MYGPTLNGVLSALAAYSNSFSIGFIVLCCVSMVVFIMRLSTDHFNSRADITPGSYVPAQAMIGAYNPFMLTIQNPSTASLTDGVTVKITSQVPFILQDFWGVNIQEVYSQIFQPWPSFQEKFSGNTLFESITQIKSEQKLFNESCQSVEVNLTTPLAEDGSEKLDLGPVPRGLYPLVLAMVVREADHLPPDSIISMVNIIHLKDSVVPVASHIITQYVRTAHTQPVPLQQLYLASTEENQSTAEQPSSDNDKDLCVICQTESISRVILPCRHACVCNDCFLRLDKCPMCRGPIVSFFMLHGGTTADPAPEASTSQLESPGHREHWWYRINDTLNDLFGLTS